MSGSTTSRVRLTDAERQELHALGGRWFDDFPEDLDRIVEGIVTRRLSEAAASQLLK